MNSQNRVPSLRFRGFNERWIVKQLDDVADIIDCKHRTPDYVEDGIPLVSPGTIKWGEIDLISPTKRVTHQDYESLMDHCDPKAGDMVFSRNQSIGVASVLVKKEKFVLGQDTVLIQTWGANPMFNYYRLQTDSVQSLISKLSGGSTFSRINLKDVRQLRISISESREEQQKIASFLSTVDGKIQQLTRKKELIEQYKRGVMQQLFSGKLRFKDENGKAFPKWDEKKFEELLDYIQPIKYLVESTEYDDSYKTPVLTAGKTFILGYTNETFNIYDKKLPVIIFDDFTTAIQFVEFPFKAKSSAMKILVAKEDENISYIFNAMQLVSFEVGGHGRHWISQYSQISIPYPCKKEQQKIASFLTALHQKIEQVTNQISQTQAFKKGLLQQMFV